MLCRSVAGVHAAGKPAAVFFSVFILHTLSLNLTIAECSSRKNGTRRCRDGYQNVSGNA